MRLALFHQVTHLQGVRFVQGSDRKLTSRIPRGSVPGVRASVWDHFALAISVSKTDVDVCCHNMGAGNISETLR